MRWLRAICVALAFGVSSAAAAEPSNTATWSALAIGSGVLELRYERLLTPTFAVVGIGGVTVVKGLTAPFLVGSVVECGAQARWYVAGTFIDGLALALEAMVVARRDDAPFDRKVVAVGPKLAYKLASRFGPTVELQVGGAAVVHFVTPYGDSAALGSYLEAQPSVNFGVGYSF